MRVVTSDTVLPACRIVHGFFSMTTVIDAFENFVVTAGAHVCGEKLGEFHIYVGRVGMKIFIADVFMTFLAGHFAVNSSGEFKRIDQPGGTCTRRDE